MILRLRLWRPGILLSRRGRRVLSGLFRNHLAFLRAHRDVPRAVPQRSPAAAQLEAP
jgi:hypothetical protein